MTADDQAARLLDRSIWLRGSAWLVGGNGLGLILTVVAGIALARALGPSDFGLYSVIVVGISIGAGLVTFRLDMHLVTELRSDPSDADTFRRSLLASSLIALPLCAAGLLAVLTLTSMPTIVVFLAIAEVALSPLLLARAVLQVQARQSALALAAVCNRIVWVALVMLILAIEPSSPLPAIFAARLVAALTEIAVVMRASGTRLTGRWPSRWRWPAPELAVLRASTPLALSGLAGMAYNRSDQLLLASLRNRTETGIYAAGVRVADLLLFFGPIVQNVTLPGMVALHRRGDKEGMRRAVTDTVLMTVVPAGFVVTLLLATKGAVVPWLFGSDYDNARWVVVVLAFGAWTALLGTAVSSVALAAGERSILFLATTAGLATNLFLNLLLLRRYGAIAAAWTSVVAYAVASLLPALRPALRGPVRAVLLASSSSMIGMLVAAALGSLMRGPGWAAFTATITYLAIIGLLQRSDGRRLLRAAVRWRSRCREESTTMAPR